MADRHLLRFIESITFPADLGGHRYCLLSDFVRLSDVTFSIRAATLSFGSFPINFRMSIQRTVARRCTSDSGLTGSRTVWLNGVTSFRSTKNAEAPQIVLGPAGLHDHALQSLGSERVAPAMKHYGNPTAVRMVVNLMRRAPAVERKSVPHKRGYYFAGREIPKEREVHASQ